MLSADLDSAAALIRAVAKEDGAIRRHTAGVLANVIEDCACQAREMEAQVAPGSPLPNNVAVLQPATQKVASA